ncbi:MAG: DegV family protein [Anaerolineae bacterium]|nr:DegV family protein [Anaerolineae bacterium]
MTIKIVTDTGSDIPPDLLAAYDIHQVPLILRFGDHEVLDSEATRAELEKRLAAGLPCDTSGPPVGAYDEAFAPLVAAGHQVLCVTLTGAHSVTYNSAWAAAQSYPGQVEVVDGRSVSLGYGLQAIEAAQLAAAGADLTTIAVALREMQSRITIRFFLESLDQVKRGGRLNALIPVMSRLGQTLNIRAILMIDEEGRITMDGPARGRKGAIRRLTQDLLETAPVETVIVGHGHSPDEAAALADKLAASLKVPRDETIVFEVGAVLLAHAGKGVLAAGTVRKRRNEQEQEDE